MHVEQSSARGGCRHRLVVVALLFWFALATVGPTVLVSRLSDGALGPAAADTVSLLAAALALILPFGALTRLLRARPGWRATGATAASLLIAAGYVVLEGLVRLLVPQDDPLVPLGSCYAAAGLRLVALGPYTLLAAWLAPRLIDASGASLSRWLGLERARRSTLFLALALAALITVPWPVTGALGDSLTTLAIGVRMLARVIPEVLLFWGVLFTLLTTSLASTGSAALIAILIYAMSALGRFLPGASGDVLWDGLFLLPLGVLLAEMRARGRSVVPLFAPGLCYLLVPALFVDPRDAVATGIPELQHVASYLLAGTAALLSGGMLFLGRRVANGRRGEGEVGRPGWIPLTLAAAAGWGLWAAVYLLAGQPGFYNHGFLILLEDQADLESAYAIQDREARLSYVYQSLVDTAQGAQSPLRAELDALGVPHRPYYVINMIRVDGHRWLMGRFEDSPSVASVILNPNVREYPRRVPLPYEPATAAAGGVQDNLAAIGADVAWEAGVEGVGIVVGGQDTGYDWDHPALQDHYRGWDGERAAHDYNWHDAWDDARVPFDDGSHGTHTMGTVLGDGGAGNRIGVAPGARWIGCRNMRRGFGNPGSYAECMEFLLAPYPLEGDPFVDGDVGLAPHVINNSWGCPDFEGCFPGTLRSGVEALRAAGIVMVVSAGNEGPACATAVTPPANYDAAVSVGATSDEGQVTGFSSRGPVDGRIKPDIAAPGERIRSSIPGGGYAYAGGTSMAAPHVAGAVALLWSADPALIDDVEGTEQLLCETATPREVNRSCASVSLPEGPFASATSPPPCACGGVTSVPNNVYGCGLLDAGAAVTIALEE